MNTASTYLYNSNPNSLRWVTEYRAWQGMKDRCYNPNCKGYKNYGGRGIKVCDRWFEYSNFLEDMGRKPTSKHTLERVNNNGDYDPLNCAWRLRKWQSRNRRNVKMTVAKAREVRMQFNKGYTQKDLAIEFDVSLSVIKGITRTVKRTYT